MNFVYFFMIAISLILLTISAPESALSIMISGAKNSLDLCFRLVTIYAIWMSLLVIMEKIGLNKLLNKLFRPLTNKLFKGESEQSKEYISLNFSANLLGMGGAATPLGIKAIESMQDGSEKATHNMALFMIINATSIQLLPTTIIGLRAAGNSASASDIILPSLLATLFSSIFGIIIAKLCAGLSKKSRPKSTVFYVTKSKSSTKLPLLNVNTYSKKPFACNNPPSLLSTKNTFLHSDHNTPDSIKNNATIYNPVLKNSISHNKNTCNNSNKLLKN